MASILIAAICLEGLFVVLGDSIFAVLPTVYGNFFVCSVPYWLWVGVSDKQHKAFTDKEFNKLISYSLCLQARACICSNYILIHLTLDKHFLKRVVYISIPLNQSFNIWPGSWSL